LYCILDTIGYSCFGMQRMRNGYSCFMMLESSFLHLCSKASIDHGLCVGGSPSMRSESIPEETYKLGAMVARSFKVVYFPRKSWSGESRRTLSLRCCSMTLRSGVPRLRQLLQLWRLVEGGRAARGLSPYLLVLSL
jgi:hypothetical protein